MSRSSRKKLHALCKSALTVEREQCWKYYRVRFIACRDWVEGVQYTRLGFPLAAYRSRVNPAGGWSEWCRVRDEVLWMLSKEMLSQRKVSGSSCMSDPAAVEAWPLLWAHLTQTAWEDGTSRVTSNLLIFTDGGHVKAMLRDRSSSLCLWIASSTLSDLFTAVELALQDPTVEWRQDRQAQGDVARRVKKK